MIGRCLAKRIVSVSTFLFVFFVYVSAVGNVYASPSQAGECQAESEWFPHNKTAEPDNENFKSTSNCVFHQWAWQMFLWLTQHDAGKPRFLSFTPPEELLGMQPRGFMPRMSKNPTPETFDEYLQAGSDAILTDHQGRAVYYSQYLDEDFVKFIKDNDLTDPAKVKGFNPDKPFDIGSIELKVSWKIVAKGENTSDFFTMKTKVNKLVNKGGNIVIDPTQTEDVTVALVGFHIAGVVNEHPEMIWATFEHKNNAPNVPHSFTPDTIISESDSTFYSAGTKYSGCNVDMANSPKQKLNESTQILSPITQVCRLYEFGNDPDNPEDRVAEMANNDENIKQLNDSVLSKLDKDDVWSNYHEVGAIWFKRIDGLKPNMPLATDDILTGSLKLSNSTIETFTQIQSTQNNCFRCHNTLHRFPPQTQLDPLPGLNLNISHAFVNIYFWSQMQQLEKSRNTE